MLCVTRPRRTIEDEPEGPIARCRSFRLCWWIFTRVPEVELCVYSISDPPRLGFLNFSLLPILSSLFLVRFWGWTENEREAALDLAELRDRAKKGLPLYGESDQPEWVQQAAYSNSAWSQLKFRESIYPTIQNIPLFSAIVYRELPNVRSRTTSFRGILIN